MERELKIGFLGEARQLVEEAEQCFLDLENAKDSTEIIEKIFRVVHNIKGSAGAVGMMDLKDFAHDLESLLLKVKKKELPLTTDLISLLLRCNDHISKIIEGLSQNLDARFDSTSLLAEIKGAHSGAPAAASASAPAPAPVVAATEPTPLVAQEPVAESPQVGPPIAAPHETPLPAEAPKTANAHPHNADESVRVNLGRLDQLIDYVGELVILQTVLTQSKSEVESPFLRKTIGQLEKISKEIQDISMGLRMVPLKQTFQKMQRIVRDTSKQLGKEVTLELSGEDTELDKTVLEQIGDPLVHLIRNAVDHGIESVEDRMLAGKPTTGHILLSAFNKGDRIVLEVRDDGHGLNPARLIEKAKEKGLLRADQTLSDKEAISLIFASGFSTKEKVTDVSGRGVGMDVVRTNIEKLNGQIEIESELYKGTAFKIVLPLTLSIIEATIVSMGDQRFVIPIANIAESLQPETKDITHVSAVGDVLNLRGESLPLFSLTKMLAPKSPAVDPTKSIALVLRAAHQKPYSVLVDDIICRQQVVIKRLGEEIQGTRGITGGAILGDGKAALILDLDEIVNSYQQGVSA